MEFASQGHPLFMLATLAVVGVAWLLPAAMGLGSLLGGIFGKPKYNGNALGGTYNSVPIDMKNFFSNSGLGGFENQQQGSSTSRTNSLGQFNEKFGSSSMPTISPEMYPLFQQLLGRSMSRLTDPQYGERETTVGGLRNINKTFDTVNQGLQNRLSSTGQAGGPSEAGAIGAMEAGRSGSIADFLNTLPDVMRGREQEDLGIASSLLSQFGRGETTSGTRSGTNSQVSDTLASFLNNAMGTNWNQNSGQSQQTGTQYLPAQPQQSALGAGINSLLPMMAYLYGSGAFGSGAGAAGAAGGGGGFSFPNWWR